MAEKGFSFTEAQKAVIAGTATQEQVIATIGEEYLSASQDVQAAAAIAASVQQTWGGLYDSMSNTPEGQIMQMTNAWGSMKEEVGGQLYPFVLLFVETITGNWGIIQTVLNAIVTGLQFIMGILSWLLEGAMGFAQVIVDNWSWISPVVYGAAAALAVFCAYLAITKVIGLAAAAVQGIMALAQIGLNGAIAACPIVWIIILIIALIAIVIALATRVAEFTGLADSGIGYIVGRLSVAATLVQNIFATVFNVIIDIFAMVLNCVAAFANFFGNVFRDPIGSVARLFFDLVDGALSALQTLAGAIDTLFGSDMAGTVQGWRDGLGSWVDDTFGEEEEIMAKVSAEDWHIEHSSYIDAWEKGVEFGDGISEAIGNFSLADFFGAEEIPSAEDYGDQYGLKDPEENSGLSDNVADIAENTGNINDSLECTQEDLKYLRDIAEQDAVNRFTIAEIKVEQTNHNNINSNLDLDGVVSGLTNAVNESIDSVTEGVHE